MLPVLFLVNLQAHSFVQVPQADRRQRTLIKRPETPPPSLNSANMFVQSVLAQTAKFKDRQYFCMVGLGPNHQI